MRAGQLTRWKRVLVLLTMVGAGVIVLVGLPLALILGGGQIAREVSATAQPAWVLALSAAVLCGIVALATGLAVLGAVRAKTELAKSQAVAHVDLLIRLDDRLRCSEYTDVLRRLQDGGTWTVSATDELDSGAEIEADWVHLTEYVRLFEPLYFLARDGGVRTDVIRGTFGFRIDQIVRSKRIVGRMVENQKEPPWFYFLQLWEMVDPDGFKQWNEFLSLWKVVSRRVQPASGMLAER